MNTNSLINKFFAFYKLTILNHNNNSNSNGNGNSGKNQIIYFMILESIFYSDLEMNEACYDLKGSTKGRITNKNGNDNSNNENDDILKDLDFVGDDRYIQIGSRLSQLFKFQLQMDLDFLSLLLGIHHKNNKTERSSRKRS
jgi:hypothetical protein